MSAIVIKSFDGNRTIHTIDTTGKTEGQIERIERGLAINFDFDFDNYYFDEVPD